MFKELILAVYILTSFSGGTGLREPVTVISKGNMTSKVQEYTLLEPIRQVTIGAWQESGLPVKKGEVLDCNAMEQEVGQMVIDSKEHPVKALMLDCKGRKFRLDTIWFTEMQGK